MKNIQALFLSLLIGTLAISCSARDNSKQAGPTSAMQTTTTDSAYATALADATQQSDTDAQSTQDTLFGDIKCRDGSTISAENLPAFMTSLAKAHNYIHQLLGVNNLKSNFDKLIAALKAAKDSTATVADFKAAITPILTQFKADREAIRTNFKAALSANKVQLDALNSAIKAVQQACTIRGPRLGNLKPIDTDVPAATDPTPPADVTPPADGIKLADSNKGFEAHDGMRFHGARLFCPIPSDLDTEIQQALQTKQTNALAQAASAACITASAALDALTSEPLPAPSAPTPATPTTN